MNMGITECYGNGQALMTGYGGGSKNLSGDLNISDRLSSKPGDCYGAIKKLHFVPPTCLTTTKVAVRPGVGPKSAIRPGGGVVRQAGNFFIFIPNYEEKLRSDRRSVVRQGGYHESGSNTPHIWHRAEERQPSTHKFQLTANQPLRNF